MALSTAMTKEQLQSSANQIFNSDLEVHGQSGTGLPESVYEHALVKELQIRDILSQYQVKVPIFCKGFDTGKEFFIDMLPENEFIIETKSADILHPVPEAQLLSYMKLIDKRLGFLINFNVTLIKEGLKRKVNNY